MAPGDVHPVNHHVAFDASTDGDARIDQLDDLILPAFAVRQA
jgi:hypothetical protein